MEEERRRSTGFMVAVGGAERGRRVDEGEKGEMWRVLGLVKSFGLRRAGRKFGFRFWYERPVSDPVKISIP